MRWTRCGTSGRRISLLLHYQNGWLSCEVSDDGPGIDPLAGGYFYKGFSTKGENRGVGLFLARQQIQNLGGDITVESEPAYLPNFLFTSPGIARGISRDKCFNCR
jgi:two-component system sensor histidine kinase DcuS